LFIEVTSQLLCVIIYIYFIIILSLSFYYLMALVQPQQLSLLNAQPQSMYAFLSASQPANTNASQVSARVPGHVHTYFQSPGTGTIPGLGVGHAHPLFSTPSFAVQKGGGDPGSAGAVSSLWC